MSTDSSSDDHAHPEQTEEPLIISLPLPRGWIDPNAAKVLRRLDQFGHQTYLVGGCVRDLLVGRYPKDFDVATSAKPREVKHTFRNCRLIGRRFRLAHILFRNSIIEVATFRQAPKDEEEEVDTVGEATGDDLLIRDDNVFGTAYDDAFRRDFTINALYYDLVQQRVIDYVNGYADIEDRIIRTIGDPARRFQEDPIRMLRAIKFSSNLGFKIEENTWNAMVEVSHDLTKSAVPRIQEEIFKMLRSGYSERAFEQLQAAGLLKLILPDQNHFFRAAPPVSNKIDEVEAALVVPVAAEIESGQQVDEALAAQAPSLSDSDSQENDADETSQDREEPWRPTTDLPPLRAYLDTFDHMVEPLGNHLYLAVLALHPAMAEVDLDLRASPQEQLTREAASWLADTGADLRLPRRDREAARHAVMGFSRMLFKRDRRRLVSTLAKKSYFPEATALYGLHCLTTGEDIDTFWRSVDRLGDAPALRPIALAVERRHGPRPPSRYNGRGRQDGRGPGRGRRGGRRRGRGRRESGPPTDKS